MRAYPGRDGPREVATSVPYRGAEVMRMPIELRLYGPNCDWAGLGFKHWMLAWTDERGIPRSLTW